MSFLQHQNWFVYVLIVIQPKSIMLQQCGFKFVSKPPQVHIQTKPSVMPSIAQVLDGHYPWTIRFLDVLQHGCVPAVVSESWHPPLHRLLAWTSEHFPVVLIHPRSMAVLDRLLAKIPYKTWATKQRTIANTNCLMMFCIFLDAGVGCFHWIILMCLLYKASVPVSMRPSDWSSSLAAKHRMKSIMACPFYQKRQQVNVKEKLHCYFASEWVRRFVVEIEVEGGQELYRCNCIFVGDMDSYGVGVSISLP